MSDYQKLRAFIKQKFEEIVALNEKRLRSDKKPTHVLIGILDAAEQRITKGKDANVHEKDPFDPVDIFIFLKKQTERGSSTEGNIFSGKKDDLFVAELKRLIADIANSKYLATPSFSTELNFSANKMSFFAEVFGKNRNNSAIDEKLFKNQDYISFRKTNPQFRDYSLSLSDIQFILNLAALIEFKKTSKVQEITNKEKVQMQEKDTNTNTNTNGLTETLEALRTDMKTIQTELQNVKSEVNKKDQDLAEVYDLINYVKSKVRIRTLLQADPSEEAQKILALRPNKNNSQGFFSATPNNSNSNLQQPVALDFSQFVHSHYENGKVSQKNVYQARNELLNNLINIITSNDGTIKEDEKKIFQLAIYYLLRCKYTLTIQGVFDLLNQSLQANDILMPEELASNFKVYVPKEELKVALEQELSLDEATMFLKLYTGTKQFPQPLLPEDEIAKQDFKNLSNHLYNSAKYPTYEKTDVYAKWLAQYKVDQVITPK